MKLTSTAFTHQSTIPELYTCVGDNRSPQLMWNAIPEGVKSFVLICDDPDAPNGTWDHWILYNIPTYVRQLEEGIQILPSDCKEGLNSWNKKGYGGPCPPSGKHRYFFRLYALDIILTFRNTPRKQDLEQVMQGHILEMATLMGYFQKPMASK